MFKKMFVFTLFLIGTYTVTTIYAGDWADAVYWKDGTWQTLSLPRGATDSYARGIAASGDAVYIAGSYRNAQGGFACYWRNGVIQNLSLPRGATDSNTSGIAVSGDVVYVAGSYTNDQDDFACYWRNGVVQNLNIPGGSKRSSTNGIAVSGDAVYVAGSYSDAQYKKFACYWRNGVMQNLNLPGGVSDCNISGIAVSGDVVYIAGTYNTGDRNRGGKAIPCYWRNGVINNLSIPDGAAIWPSRSINGITVVGDVVYIAGSYYINDLMYNAIPCYWRNGELHNLSLSDGTDNSNVSAIAIAVSGNIIHIAGTSSYGGVYWRNGVMQNLNKPLNFQNKYTNINGIAVSGNSIYIAHTFWMQ
jgi:hypothetical protein